MDRKIINRVPQVRQYSVDSASYPSKRVGQGEAAVLVLYPVVPQPPEQLRRNVHANAFPQRLQIDGNLPAMGKERSPVAPARA